MSCASRGAFACASGHEPVSSSNNLYGESNVEWCQDRSCRCLRALHRCSWCGRDARARSRARMGGGCSGFQGTLGLRVRGANLGPSASRGPAGLRRARMRYPGNSAGSLPRLCGEPCGRILVWRRPRSHATRGPLHGPARMRAGRAGSNVPSREVALRVTDRDIRAGYGPHIAPCKHSRRQDVTAATPAGDAALPFELLTCRGATAATWGR